MSPVRAAKTRITTIDQPPRAAVVEIVKVSPPPDGEVSLRVKPDRRVRQEPLTGFERRFSKAPTT